VLNVFQLGESEAPLNVVSNKLSQMRRFKKVDIISVDVVSRGRAFQTSKPLVLPELSWINISDIGGSHAASDVAHRTQLGGSQCTDVVLLVARLHSCKRRQQLQRKTTKHVTHTHANTLHVFLREL